MKRWVRLLTILLILAPSSRAYAIEQPGQVLGDEVGIFTQLGTKVDFSLPLTDSTGETRPLGQFLSTDKPVVLVPVYYKCPYLCSLLLNGVYNLLNQLTVKLGKDFSIAVVSFDTRETPADARAALEKFKLRLNPDIVSGIETSHFFVGNEEVITKLMSSIGFRYQRDGEDFAHSAAIMILTPTGEISQYFTGIEFSPWDVRLALIDASKGSIGTAIDHLLLYCFRFDPLQGKYTWAVVGLLRVGGALTLLGLAAVYLFFVVRKRPQVT